MKRNTAYSQRTADRVIETIFRYGKDGITQKKVGELTNIHRSIIGAICEDNQDKIKIKRVGKFTTYVPKYSAVDTLVFDKPTFFGRQLRYYFLQPKHSGFELGFDELIQLHQKQVEYLTESSDPNNKVDYNTRQNIVDLQNFIIKVGTMLTFTLLQAMSPEIINQLSGKREQYNNIKINSIETRNKLVRNWINDVILSTRLLDQLRNILSDDKKDFELSQDLVNISLEGMRKLYPDLIGPYSEYNELAGQPIPGVMTKLETIYDNLDDSIREEKDKLKKDICNHKFDRLAHYGSYKEIKYFKCLKCGFRKEEPK